MEEVFEHKYRSKVIMRIQVKSDEKVSTIYQIAAHHEYKSTRISEDSLLKSLNKRVGAVKKISKSASFKTRKMIANGLFISKLIYLMPVWNMDGM